MAERAGAPALRPVDGKDRAPAAGLRIGRPKGTGTQRVYDQVREDILSLKLPAGADLHESSLEARFGVSRTPVREALIRLASEGLVRLLPNRGARVTPIDVSEIPQLFEALEVCQRATIRWAALRRTPNDIAEMQRLNREFLNAARRGDYERMGETNKDFHAVVARACGNRYFGDQYAALLAVSLRLARTVFTYAPQSGDSPEGYYLEIVRQHAAMIEAVEKGDAETADALARQHTQLFRDRIVRYVNISLAGGLSLGAES